ARDRAGNLSNVDYRLGEAWALHTEGATFDDVIVNILLHHTPNPGQTLAEIAALTKPGGVLVISELCSHDQDWARAACGDLWLGFEPAELTDWAARAGLSGQAELFIAQRNGFQIQVRLFQKNKTSNIKEFQL
ncbi:MAG: methyltransferase domain-containing protein, partial [Luminiphilus sp.]